VDLAGLATLQQLGREIAKVLAVREPRPLVIASSDMTHFEPEGVARAQDKQAIDAMGKLDEAELYTVVQEQGITMCGIAPATVAIAAVKELGGKRGELVRYDTSATASGDASSVVGYAGVIFA
jgi:MEMO1 family protein